jgi:hypothetical protein
LDKVFKKFRELIEKEEFFDAHEVLEEIWHPMRKSNHPDSDIIRGFINAAVSLELKKRGRNNYLKVWNTYEKHKVKIKNNKLYFEMAEFLDNYKQKGCNNC